jgi:hypothetical protein
LGNVLLRNLEHCGPRWGDFREGAVKVEAGIQNNTAVAKGNGKNGSGVQGGIEHYCLLREGLQSNADTAFVVGARQRHRRMLPHCAQDIVLQLAGTNDGNSLQRESGAVLERDVLVYKKHALEAAQHHDGIGRLLEEAGEEGGGLVRNGAYSVRHGGHNKNGIVSAVQKAHLRALQIGNEVTARPRCGSKRLRNSEQQANVLERHGLPIHAAAGVYAQVRQKRRLRVLPPQRMVEWICVHRHHTVAILCPCRETLLHPVPQQRRRLRRKAQDMANCQQCRNQRCCDNSWHSAHEHHCSGAGSGLPRKLHGF